MIILALDTATEACSAAVLTPDQHLIERFELAPRRHADLILPMIDAVLAEAGLTLTDVDALAFGRGPGAFTGLRIAVSTVQGIGFATGLPVVPVSTLAALARQAMRRSQNTDIAVAIDARMNEVYWGCFRADGPDDLSALTAEQVAAPGDVNVPDGGPWTAIGSGWDAYNEQLHSRLTIAAQLDSGYPRAADIAMLAAAGYRRGEAVSAEQALPVYLRDRVTHRAGT